jgi:L-ribulose-5-phosphate 3-epimerase
MRMSFMTANFVARELGWRMSDWEDGDRATNDAFSPIPTFPERFGDLLDEAVALGFGAIDLWEAHLSPQWATGAHHEAAQGALRERGIGVASMAGWFGSDRETFAAFCRLAVAVGAPILGGRTGLLPDDRGWVEAQLRRHGLRLGVENHPERSMEEVTATIGDGEDGLIGATVDTGWFATHGVDPVAAIRHLGTRVVHVHLKDVAQVGPPHQTTAYGRGVVDLAGCIRALDEIGYSGGISVEHVPDDHDPREEIRDARQALEGWLAA